MSSVDIEFKAAQRPATGVAVPFLGRSALVMGIAALEGAVAAVIVFVVAFAYHLAVLHTPLDEFGWLRYIAFAVLAGLLYGGFSASATARLLDQGERHTFAALPGAFYGWTAALALTLLTAFLLGAVGDLSRVSLSAAYLVGIPVVLAVRTRAQRLLSSRISSGTLHYQRVAVIGSRSDVRNFLLTGDLWRQGHAVTDTLYLEDVTTAAGSYDLAALADFARATLRRQTDSMVIVAALHDLDAMEALVTEMKRFAVNVVYAPATSNRSLKFLDVVPIGANNALRFVRKPLSDVAVFAKRSFDIGFALTGLILLAPLFALVALAIILDNPGPVIFRQARRGFNGESFMIWKFRSMSVMESGHAMVQARRGDARITRVGRFIRMTSIDELPQLVNVLLGDMSIVGPRPHAVSHDDELGRVIASYAHRQRIKPGITGWAQVNGFRGETTTLEAMEGRTLHDLHYIDNWSLVLDFWIILLTVFSFRTHRNVF